MYLARQILVKKMKSHLVDLLIIIVVVVVVMIIITSIVIIIIKRQARLASYWIRHLNIV